jgi:hypothetical protein
MAHGVDGIVEDTHRILEACCGLGRGGKEDGGVGGARSDALCVFLVI